MEKELNYQYFLSKRNHWWIDSGIVGLYNIAKYLTNMNSDYDSISCSVNSQGITFHASSQERLHAFLDFCYEELASRYWNVSTPKQKEAKDLVIYDENTDRFLLSPRRSPTPIPSLFTKGSSYRAKNKKYKELSPEMQKRIDKFLHENKKSLWGDKKRLLYESPVCHPKINLFPKRGKKTTCCICGRQNICNEISQTSFLLFASSTATLSFNSEGQMPDKICWECEYLSKFAIDAAFYKQSLKDGKPSNLFILQIATGDTEKLINSHSLLGSQSTIRQFDEDNLLSNFGTTKSDNRLLYYARMPYEYLWAYFHDTYELLRIEGEKNSDSADNLRILCIKPVIETPLEIILLMIGYKGQTFMMKEIIHYSETVYAYRLIHSLNEEFSEDNKFLFKVFQDLYLPKEGKTLDINNHLWRNEILQRVLQKKNILQAIESFSFKKSLKVSFPYLGDLLNFTKSYQLIIREEEDMTQEQVDIAVNLGKQIVLSAKDAAKDTSESNFDRVKGDLFALRKTRTASDFLEQLNRIQFRYNIVVSNQILGGILEKTPFNDFKSYCLLGALNTYNNIKRQRENQDKAAQ